MKKLLYFLSALLLVTTSCKKDDDDSCAVTKENLAGTYRIVSVTANGIDVMDLYFEDCEQDNQVTLNVDGTYTATDTGAQCDPPGGSTGNWELTGNTFSIDIFPGDLNIQSFDCTTLKGNANISGANVEATFRKI